MKHYLIEFEKIIFELVVFAAVLAILAILSGYAVGLLDKEFEVSQKMKQQHRQQNFRDSVYRQNKVWCNKHQHLDFCREELLVDKV